MDCCDDCWKLDLLNRVVYFSSKYIFLSKGDFERLIRNAEMSNFEVRKCSCNKFNTIISTVFLFSKVSNEKFIASD